MSTEFITVKDEYVNAEWPDSSHTLITVVQGDLADKIRGRAGRDGEVQILENGEEGGYSEWTVEWEWDFVVKIDGVTVFSTDYAGYSNSDFRELGHLSQYNGLAMLLRWLDGGAS